MSTAASAGGALVVCCAAHVGIATAGGFALDWPVVLVLVAPAVLVLAAATRRKNSADCR